MTSHALDVLRARAADDGARAPGRFARALHSCREPRAAGSLVGVEHEYRVIDASGAAVDFRALIHTLPIDGRRIDPGDRNAYRLPSGLALTADEAEAEIATPPVPVDVGFAPQAASLAAEGRRTLESLLPPGLHLDGYSTHVSVSVPAGFLEALAPRYALTFGVAFAALGEGAESLGILVRPRPGRLELCCDFVEGVRLAGLVAFAAGTVRASAEALASGHEQRLPPALDVTLLAARERFGYRLHRQAALGLDLYAAGRRAVLPLQGGGTTTLGTRTEEAWRIAVSRLGRALDPDTRARVDSTVRGLLPLGIEGAGGQRAPERLPATARAWRPCARAYQRPAFSAEPVIATWDFTVYCLQGSRRAYASVPRPALRAFERLLDAGSLDAIVSAFLAVQPSGRILASHPQALEPGLFDEVAADPLLLLPEEHPVSTDMAATVRAGKGARPSARPGKTGGPVRPGKAVVRPFGPPVRGRTEGPGLAAGEGSPIAATPSWGLPWRPLAGIAAAVVLAVGLVGGAIAFGHNPGDDSPQPAPSSEATSSGRPGETPVSAASALATPSGGGTVVAPTPTMAAGETGTATASAAPPSATAPGGASATATIPPSPAATATPAATPTVTPSPAATDTPTATPTVALTPSPTATVTATPTATLTPTPTTTPTPDAAPVIRNVVCSSVDRNVPSSCQVFMGDIGPEATSFSWTAEGGTPAVGAGPSFGPAFSTAGPHTVSVTACAGSACDTRSTVVNVS